ncbi:hypothetical protein DPMN_022031 [Dreissena polymorpha]|uniref:Uncharacterized protein n=1 Tax=Dreissena polymorpha TaxID=45954 RepID=A0A9D4NNQ2_DREPO|nr:hypothetical protein DPMN_022031 [Dreissena polymorpha]
MPDKSLELKRSDPTVAAAAAATRTISSIFVVFWDMGLHIGTQLNNRLSGKLGPDRCSQSKAGAPNCPAKWADITSSTMYIVSIRAPTIAAPQPNPCEHLGRAAEEQPGVPG